MPTASTTDPNKILERADALNAEGRSAEAENLYRQLLASYPGQPALLHRLALAAKARGSFGEAESMLRRALVGAPGEPVLHNNLGNVLRNATRLADAEACYRKAISLNPDYGEAHYNLGVVLEDLMRSNDAFEAYRRSLQLNDKHTASRVRVGALLADRGEFEAALSELDTAIAQEPQSFEALYYRGLALARLERFSEAADALQAAVSARPSSAEALAALANNFKAVGRNDEAIDALWRLIELQPLQVSTHDELNRMAWMAGRTDTFLKSFAYVRDRHGDDPGLLFAEAQIRMQRNDPVGAEPLLRRAIEIAPEQSPSHAMIGRLLSRRKRWEESYRAFETAIKIDPGVTTYRNEFGYALLLGKEPASALAQFEAALRVNPVDQLAFGGVGLAYRALGDSRYQRLMDKDRFIRVYPLRLPAGFSDAASFNAVLAEELLKLHTMTAEPLEQTLRGGSQTAGLLFTRKLKTIETVRDMIQEAVAAYIREMPFDPSHPLLSRKQEQFSFTHSWSCKLRSAGFHTNHVHPMGWISSAYYVSLPDALEDQATRQGWLKFGESHLELGGDDRPEHFVKPVVGHLALFPSYFWHGTVPFESSDDRLTVAFDVVPGLVDPSTISPGPY